MDERLWFHGMKILYSSSTLQTPRDGMGQLVVNWLILWIAKHCKSKKNTVSKEWLHVHVNRIEYMQPTNQQQVPLLRRIPSQSHNYHCELYGQRRWWYCRALSWPIVLLQFEIVSSSEIWRLQFSLSISLSLRSQRNRFRVIPAITIQN